MAKETIDTVKTFEKFLGMELNGRIVDEDILKKAINKCVGDKRVSKKVLSTESDAFIIREYVEADDVFRAISSAMNLKVRLPDTSVKFDDVRNMTLGLDNLEGYTEQEKDFMKSRLSVYKEFYFGSNIVAPNDEFDLLDIIDLEREIEQLKTFIRLNPKKGEEERKLIAILRKQRSDALVGLNAKKLQRDNVKKPKDNGSTISNQLNEFDKPVEELQHDVDAEEQEELLMMKKRKK